MAFERQAMVTSVLKQKLIEKLRGIISKLQLMQCVLLCTNYTFIFEKKHVKTKV